MKTRKSQTTALLVGGVAFILSFLLLIIGASVGGQVLGNIRETQGNTGCVGHYWNTTSQHCEESSTNSTQVAGNDAAYNASNNGLLGLTQYGSQFGTVGLIAGAALIISVLVGGFAAVRGV